MTIDEGGDSAEHEPNWPGTLFRDIDDVAIAMKNIEAPRAALGQRLGFRFGDEETVGDSGSRDFGHDVRIEFPGHGRPISVNLELWSGRMSR